MPCAPCLRQARCTAGADLRVQHRKHRGDVAAAGKLSRAEAGELLAQVLHPSHAHRTRRLSALERGATSSPEPC